MQRSGEIFYPVLLAVLLVLALALLLIVPRRRRRARRQRLAGAELPQSHAAILKRNVPLYRRMPAGLQSQLRGHVNVFLNEKTFIGCNGFEITDEVRVTIAGHACFLLLNRDTEYFPNFTSILVYPDAYLVDEVVYDGLVETAGQEARSGESWHRGPVVLSWRDVLDSLEDDSEGYNVVMHEFAHKLDEENGEVDGVPTLAESSHYKEWAEVLSRAYGATATAGTDSDLRVLDEYAFTAPEEFFAVATETFFENGTRLRAELPDLYGQLRRFYCVDPASWEK